MAIEVKDDGDNFNVHIDGVKVGFIPKAALQDREKLEKVLRAVVVAWYNSTWEPKRSTKKTSLAGDIFHLCTLGIFEK